MIFIGKNMKNKKWQSKAICLNIPSQLLEKVDDICANDFVSRSHFVVTSLKKSLEEKGIDVNENMPNQ